MPERHRAQELQVAERVRFLGVVPDTLPVLHAADAYLMPSSLEGFGIAAVEAMAAGAPVILSDVPALNEFRGHVDTITWIQPDARQLATAIAGLAATGPQQRRALGQAGSETVTRLFGVERGAGAYLSLYRQPWGGRRRGRGRASAQANTSM